jgi:hypothetical protein
MLARRHGRNDSPSRSLTGRSVWADGTRSVHHTPPGPARFDQPPGLSRLLVPCRSRPERVGILTSVVATTPGPRIRELPGR